MFLVIVQNLKRSWKQLVATDILFKAVAFILLTPSVSLLFRGFLAISGRTVLADADIARFLLHPLGWMAVIVVGGAMIGVLALEQSVLMAIGLASKHRHSLTILGSFWFVARKAKGLFQLAARIVARILLLIAPFLAVGGGVYWLLLTKHDINHYLTNQPPEFWVAVVVITADFAVMTALLIRCIVNWSVAMQLYLFENVPPKDCLKISLERVHGNRKKITSYVVVWLTVYALISAVGSALVFWLGSHLVPISVGHLWTLIITLGVVLLVWGFVNLSTSLLAVITFALLQVQVYDTMGRSDDFVLPGDENLQLPWALRWSRGRIAAALIVATLVAAMIGVTAIHSVRLDDDVQITAHRGASGKAPENTLASVRQAIADGADWVEIDVQETKDGVVIVAHDSDLMKVSGFGTKIWDATADDLRSIDIGSYFADEFKEERVPTLAEVLTECHGRVGLNIELKYYGHDQNLEQKVVDLVEEHQMVSDVVIMSLELKGIQKIQQLRPQWKVGLLTAVVAGDLTRIDVDFLAVSTKIANRSFIRSAHRQEKEVYVWTVNDPLTMSTMISRGADNLITDHPELARRVLEDRADMSPAERILVELSVIFGAVPEQTPQQ